MGMSAVMSVLAMVFAFPDLPAQVHHVQSKDGGEEEINVLRRDPSAVSQNGDPHALNRGKLRRQEHEPDNSDNRAVECV